MRSPLRSATMWSPTATRSSPTVIPAKRNPLRGCGCGGGCWCGCWAGIIEGLLPGSGHARAVAAGSRPDGDAARAEEAVVPLTDRVLDIGGGGLAAGGAVLRADLAQLGLGVLAAGVALGLGTQLAVDDRLVALGRAWWGMR